MFATACRISKMRAGWRCFARRASSILLVGPSWQKQPEETLGQEPGLGSGALECDLARRPRVGRRIVPRISLGCFILVVCLVGCWVVVFASVCMFVRSRGFSRTFREFLAPFGQSWEPFRVNFGSFGSRLGRILGSPGRSGIHFGIWRVPWAQFFVL